MTWRLHHRAVTASTNLDACAGRPGDVFTADKQTAGRGRLDHAWHSAPGANLMFSAVLDVADIPPADAATLPLVVGLAVLRALARAVPAPRRPVLKWPNDILIDGRKICGILCERHRDNVIAGVGVNVNERAFPPDLAARATSLALLSPAPPPRDVLLRDILAELAAWYGVWRADGFAAIHPHVAEADFLKGQTVRVFATDADPEPVTGLCGGIRPDGTLDVAGTPVFAGEAHVCL